MSQATITHIDGCGLPIRGSDIDTDQIIPARYLKMVTFEGMGKYAFYDRRFDSEGQPLEHPLNDSRYHGATILIVNRNFGCGSSREHAPQALMRFGFRAIIGESFAEIFAGNCTALGIPAVTLPAKQVEEIMEQIEQQPKSKLVIDLPTSTATVDETRYSFGMPEAFRYSLLNGMWDSTMMLLNNINKIKQTTSRLPYLHNFQPTGA